MRAPYLKTLFALVIASTQLAVAGIHIDVNKLWPYHEVTTCFASSDLYTRTFAEQGIIETTDWKAEDKANFKKWAQEDYTPEKTGIYFVGFEECSEIPDADVILFYAPKNSALKRFLIGANKMTITGFATMGVRHKLVRGYPQAKAYIVIRDKGMNKRSVVHEFGHVAGLYHEHEHPDAATVDSKCFAVTKKQKIYPEMVYVDYDGKSSMNYCTFSQETMGIGLSSKDRALLRSLYPN
jgi:hypothetical protein